MGKRIFLHSETPWTYFSPQNGDEADEDSYRGFPEIRDARNRVIIATISQPAGWGPSSDLLLFATAEYDYPRLVECVNGCENIVDPGENVGLAFQVLRDAAGFDDSINDVEQIKTFRWQIVNLARMMLKSSGL